MPHLLNSVVDPSVLKRVEPLCAEFEKLLVEGRRPSIEAFVGRADAADRAVLTIELVEMELEHRRLHGEFPKLADYRERFGGGS